VLPPQTLSPFYVARAKECAAKVARALDISGPFNIQFLAKGADVSIIECNLRASRSTPFVSKTVGCDFVALATRIALGKDVRGDPDLPGLASPPRPTAYVGIKAPMFSFTRLGGADPVLGVEMKSTGEVACFGANMHEAFLKSLVATNFPLPKKGKGILLGAEGPALADLAHSAYKLHALGYALFATPTAAAFLAARGIAVTSLALPASAKAADVLASPLIDAIKAKSVDLVVQLPSVFSTNAEGDRVMRRTAVDHAIPLLTNLKLAALVRWGNGGACRERCARDSSTSFPPPPPAARRLARGARQEPHGRPHSAGARRPLQERGRLGRVDRRARLPLSEIVLVSHL
jgi:carbamoyl-phosphate synthase (ammonia)